MKQAGLMYRGAEAELYKTSYMGIECVLKKRVPKSFRLKDIDEKIRQQRTRTEIKSLISARKIVNAPRVLQVDLNNAAFTIEYIDGEKLKDIIDEKQIDVEAIEKTAEAIKAMHDNNLIHGDLTTSNIIRKGNEIYFIDFGLSTNSDKNEDQAVDLLVLKKMLRTSHPRQFEEIWGLIEKTYGSKPISEKIIEIEKRARYF
ncbi:MAG: Kae1-associated serine/threonine protein kinase [DPANN group archaeon]|nr:Kae1-associated serine/threonine protein kinase [DPANN group archaeon]